MHNAKFVKIAIPVLAILVLNSVYLGFGFSKQPQIQAGTWDFPRLDTLYMVEAWPWTTALTMAKECKIDVYLSSIQTSAIEELMAEGWTVTHSGGGMHYCYFGFNCRDYMPMWSSPVIDYHGRTPGFPFYPLNISSFRHAIPYIVGCEKTGWLWDIYKYIVVRVDMPMPPGFGEWINPYILQYPQDWAMAEDILLENGFTVDKQGHPDDRTYWIWYMPNGVKLVGGINSGSPGSDRYAGAGTYGIYVISPGAAPTSVEITRRHVKKWNAFFIGEEIEGITESYALFHHDIIPVTGDIITIVWIARAHDIFMLCASFGARNPDYLFDTFHSSQDVEDGNDDSGIVHAGLDRILYPIKFFMMKDFELLAYNTGEDPEVYVDAGTHFTVAQPTDIVDVVIERCRKFGVYDEVLVSGVDYSLFGPDLTILVDITLEPGDAIEVLYADGTYTRIIYDVDFFRDIVWLADWKLFYLNPQIGIYGRDYYDLFKPGHEGWIEMPGYGAGTYILPWTFAAIHETGVPVGGSMKWQNDGDVVTLNIIKAKWVYEFEILNRIYEGLITRHPTTGVEMPWIAYKIVEEPWTAPGGVPGQKIHFYIRNDVTWQDGTPVTANDIKWCYDYIATVLPDIGTPMPEFYTLWSVYQGCEVPDTYEAVVYINSTGHWKTLDFAGSALIFPKQIWEGLDTYADRTAFQPWEVSYESRVGHAPPNGLEGLTCLIGTGPFFLNLTAGGWNEADLAVLSKYPDYWVRKATANTNGLLVGSIVEVGVGSDYYTIGFTNVNPSETLTFTFWAAFKDYGPSGSRPGQSVTLAPYETKVFRYGPTFSQMTGDLGGAKVTPPTPRFFDYDQKVNSLDLNLFLKAFKGQDDIGQGTSTNPKTPQLYTIWINNALFLER